MVRGYSLLTFSEAVGMHAGAVRKIEVGTTVPYNRTLQRLADALDVTVADLVPTADMAVLHQVQNGERPRNRMELQTLARSVGRPVKDLLAMSVDADPFAVGTPGQQRDAQWFKTLWDRFQFPQGVHLRRIHYRLLSYALQLPDGQAYENTWAHYVFLNDAGRYARILGLVAPDAFDDRRHPPPHLHAAARTPPAPFYSVEYFPTWDLPHIDSDLAEQVALTLPAVQVAGYDYDPADQPYWLEVWIEKSTMDDVLLPLCQQLGVNLVTSVGMQSITNTVKLLQRVAAADKPTRIFYISDFDPAGEVMPTAVARQAEFWLAQYAPGADIKLTPLALTHAQVEAYQLPRIPVKDGDTRRGGFEERYGAGAVELDALEALHPGELAQLVTAALRPYLDHTLPARLARVAAFAHNRASVAWSSATETLAHERDAYEAQAHAILRRYEDRLQALDDDLQAELAPLGEALTYLGEAVDAAADALAVELPERPAPEPAVPAERAWLFASERDYLTQLEAYQARKRGTTSAVDDDVA